MLLFETALEYATTDKQKRDINNSLDHIDPIKSRFRI